MLPRTELPEFKERADIQRLYSTLQHLQKKNSINNTSLKKVITAVTKVKIIIILRCNTSKKKKRAIARIPYQVTRPGMVSLVSYH